MQTMTAIVLAAGQSRRMGQSKLLLPWRDTTVLETTLDHVISAELTPFLVTGAYRPQIEAIAHKLNIATVHNPAFATGEMLSSVQAGLHEIDGTCDAFMVVLGDMPMVSAEILRSLTTQFNQSDASIVAPTFDGRQGHPVIFGRKHIPALLALKGERGDTPRKVIRANRSELLHVPIASNTILADLDTPETYQHWRRQTGQLEFEDIPSTQEISHMSTPFQAFVVEQPEPKTFTRSIQTRHTDDLPAGDVLIRVAYSSLNYKDGLSATGNPGVTRNFPHTPGIDAAGTVAESAVDAFAVGDDVVVIGYQMGMSVDGGYGQYIRVPAGWVVKLPDGLTQREAMIIGTAGFTAAMCIDAIVKGGVLPEHGDVLVTGATGGVGSMAVKLLAHLGYRVVAATGKLEQAGDFLRALGAAEVVGRDAVTNTSRPMLKGRWAGVVDTVGGPMLETALAMAKPLSVVAICGLVASAELHTTVFPFILRGVTMAGIDSGNFPIDRRAALWHKLANDWKLDGLEAMAREVGLPELSDEIDKILAGQQTGRVLVKLP